MTTPSWANSPIHQEIRDAGLDECKREAERPLDAAACSRSSDTPETDALDAQEKEVHAAFFEMRTHAWNLERQRDTITHNAAREIATLREALRLVDGHLEIIEDYGHGPHMDNATIARGIIAAAISSENANMEARPDGSPTQQ